MAKAGRWAAHPKPSYTPEACCRMSIAWVNGEPPSTVIASAACLATISAIASSMPGRSRVMISPAH